MTWSPGDPWPSATPGGVVHPRWGGYTKLWVLAEIAAGTPLKVGPDPDDRLDAGNVVGGVGELAGGGDTTPGLLPPTDGLWVDLSCQLTELETKGGAPSAAGVLSQTEAGTLSATVYDPDGLFDPLNPDTPFALGGLSRLGGGRRIKVFAETIVDPAAGTVIVTTDHIFTGTVDEWRAEWHGADLSFDPPLRFTQLTATDRVKGLANMDRGEQPPVGAGDTVLGRMTRICNYFGVETPTGFGVYPPRTLAATTLAQSAWEMLTRATQDDLGFLYVDGAGHLIFQQREAWQFRGTPVVDFTIGNRDPGSFDIVTDATPSALDADVINSVTAARDGGVEQTASNATSLASPWGERSYKRTDLGLADDTQVARWASDLVILEAFPRRAVQTIRLAPGLGTEPWLSAQKVLRMVPVATIIGLVFDSPTGYRIDVAARMVGWTHRFTPSGWSTEWATVAANIGSGASVLHVGPAVYDRLDAGNVVA